VQGNNHDDVRRHNLSTLLRLVHRGGQVSRSQLTRLTGLNRSTIGALVAELVERNLVVEGQPQPTNQVGRPSPVVAANSRVLAFAVNPEIDAVTVGLVGLGGVVHRRIRHELERSPSPSEAVRVASNAIASLSAGLAPTDRMAGIGVAVPGLVRATDGLVRHAPHLGWRDAPFSDLLGAATGLRVAADNDANLGVSAERFFGAARGMTDVIYLNGGSSGIGSGLIIGGRPAGGIAGYAGELGHSRVSGNATTDSAGIAGTLEAEVTRVALLEALGLRYADAEQLERALLDSESSRVAAVVARQLDHLAVALAGAINMLNPQLVVLGGFLAALHAADPGRLETGIRSLALAATFEGVRVCAAELGSDLLMIGAAECAFEGVLSDPAGWDSPGNAA